MLLGTVMVFIILFLNNESNFDIEERNDLKRELLELREDDYLLGNADAKVMIVKYSDAHCRFCRLLYPKFKDIISEYPENSVSFIYRNIPLFSSRGSISTSEILTECIGRTLGNQEVFNFLDILFLLLEEKGTLTYDPFEEVFESGMRVGLTEDQIQNCLEEKDIKEHLIQEHNTGGALGVVAIPHTFIVSEDEVYEIIGNKSASTYRIIIDSMLSE